ncbi:hypothetical protein PUNSTDRAFT_137588 [Punctularia strigosozonata HHB-11173 SS5]|uniref:uncharacterized protein n=1 Tax=Punctularia strigosozonata (strain HHB-11173) TaxID=741275 RepID=UPI0004417388|nr:uncharacterized protein PUNSTDRAFT_137588 [Punctularia strigosozonata HHB-11173 SS5]EIN05475.1 hypothetical protein PUNSTDRAFT_137588 [Punctularia strigosozonata HHB-11173 SS5]
MKSVFETAERFVSLRYLELDCLAVSWSTLNVRNLVKLCITHIPFDHRPTGVDLSRILANCSHSLHDLRIGGGVSGPFSSERVSLPRLRILKIGFLDSPHAISLFSLLSAPRLTQLSLVDYESTYGYPPMDSSDLFEYLSQESASDPPDVQRTLRLPSLQILDLEHVHVADAVIFGAFLSACRTLSCIQLTHCSIPLLEALVATILPDNAMVNKSGRQDDLQWLYSLPLPCLQALECHGHSASSTASEALLKETLLARIACVLPGPDDEDRGAPGRLRFLQRLKRAHGAAAAIRIAVQDNYYRNRWQPPEAERPPRQQGWYQQENENEDEDDGYEECEDNEDVTEDKDQEGDEENYDEDLGTYILRHRPNYFFQ